MQSSDWVRLRGCIPTMSYICRMEIRLCPWKHYLLCEPLIIEAQLKILCFILIEKQKLFFLTQFILPLKTEFPFLHSFIHLKGLCLLAQFHVFYYPPSLLSLRILSLFHINSFYFSWWVQNLIHYLALYKTLLSFPFLEFLAMKLINKLHKLGIMKHYLNPYCSQTCFTASELIILAICRFVRIPDVPHSKSILEHKIF